MNLFDIFESHDDLFAESPKAKILAILQDAKEGRQRAIAKMQSRPDHYSNAELVAKAQAIEGMDVIAQTLKFGGVEAAAKEWNRLFYANAYSGEPGAAELSDEGLELAYRIKDDTGVDFFRLSQILGESKDDMFAMPWRIKVISLLIKLLESPERQRAALITPEDIDNIKMLVDALQKNDIDRAKSLWDNFIDNDLDAALDAYISYLLPDIDLHQLLGGDDDLDESDDMFADPRLHEKIISLLDDADVYQQEGDAYSAIKCLEEADFFQQRLTDEQNPNKEEIHNEIQDLIHELDSGEFDAYEIHGTIQDLVDNFYVQPLGENDDMFAAKKKADLSKLSTANLIQHLQLISQDKRAEYAAAHKGQATQIKMELKRRGVLLPHGVDELDEEDDMFAPAKKLPAHLKGWLGHPIIGSARIVRDIADRIDWRDEWQVDDLDQLPTEWHAFFTKAGETVPVINLNEQGNIAVIYIMPGHPLRVFTKYLADIRVDHPTAIDENEDDDMFAGSNRLSKFEIIKTLELLKFDDTFKRRYEVTPRELEVIENIVADLKNDNLYAAAEDWYRLNLHHGDVARRVHHKIRREHNINLDDYFMDINLRSITEAEDEMFASAFRVEPEVMAWQRQASRWAGVRGMHSKDIGKDVIFWTEDPEGNVAGVYYSPQPARDETNIGTYRPRFIGNLDQYMAQDPHNPLRQVTEETDDDMFAPSAMSKNLPNIIKDLTYIAQKMEEWPGEYLESDIGWHLDDLSEEEVDALISETEATANTFREIAEAFKSSGIAGGVAKLLSFRNSPNSVTSESVSFLIDELYDMYNVDVRRFMAEEDDMFASTTQAETMGNQLIRYGNVLLKIGADRNLENVSIEGDLIVRVGEVFKRNGLEAGVRVYRTLGDKPKQDIHSLFQEVLGINVDELVNSL